MAIKEILEKKGYRVGFYKSIFYGMKLEDGNIDTSWTLYIVHPRSGCSPTLFLEEIPA